MIRRLRRTWNRFLGSLRGSRREQDLADEFASHIDMLTEDNVRRGMPREQARREAALQFGNLESAKEEYRRQRGLPFLDALAQDLRFSMRGIRRNPGFAAVAVLSLAIGIGAGTAIFSVVDTVLLRPLAFRDPDRIYAIREMIPQIAGQISIPVNPVHVREWGKQCPSIEQIALLARSNAVLSGGGGEPEIVPGAYVPHNLFSLFGVAPLLGRTFHPQEQQEGSNRVVVLSETLWRSRFHADPAIVGKSILLSGRMHEVVGIVPGWFRLPYPGEMEAVAPNIHLQHFRPIVLGSRDNRPMGNFNYGAVARLKPGATAEQALAEVNVVQAQFPPQAGEKLELKAKLIPIMDLVVSRARLGLWMLLGAVGAVLLIVCVNLANLLLSRIASQGREAAIRTALGASRARQFRQFLTENLLLAFSGGALGVLFAAWMLKAILGITALDIPRLEEVTLDARVLGFSLCLTAATGLLFATLPAWRLTRSDPQEALRAGSHTITEGRGGLRLRQALVGLEVGLSTALLIVGALLAGSLIRLLNVDKGFDAAHVLTTPLSLSGALYREPETRERFFDRLLARLNATPGVSHAALVTALPTQGETWIDPIYLEGDNRPTLERPMVNNRYASPAYFAAMNIAILHGRAFDEGDRGRGVAVLSAKAARLLWPSEPNPVGRRFIGEDDQPKTLIGVAADVRASLDAPAPPTAYYPYWQRVPDGATLVLRANGDPAPVSAALRNAIRNEDPALPIREVRTMREVVDRSVSERKLQLMLVLLFAGSALLVAALGIYGVVSYSVARRRSEIGIRIAVGAQPRELLRLIIRQGMIPVTAGLALGIVAALLLAQTIRGLLYGVQPTDPATMAAVSATLLAVGALACFFPARRAANTDAIAALRFE